MLIYDGDCGFCTSSARWIEARGARAEAWQTLDLAELQLTVADVNEAAWWIDGASRKYRGHLAIGQALIAAGGIWGFIGAVLVRPPVSWIAKPVYTLIARNRDKLPGNACELKRRPPPIANDRRRSRHTEICRKYCKERGSPRRFRGVERELTHRHLTERCGVELSG